MNTLFAVLIVSLMLLAVGVNLPVALNTATRVARELKEGSENSASYTEDATMNVRK